MAIQTLTLTTAPFLPPPPFAGVDEAGPRAYAGPQDGDWHVDAAVAASGDGTSAATAFKTISEAVQVAEAGDTVVIHGGTYREEVNLQPFGIRQGTAGAPITYTRRGTEEVIVTGGEVVAGTWTRCASAADAGGNPAWASIWYLDVAAATIPDPLLANFHQSDKQMHKPQSGAGYYEGGLQVEDRLAGDGVRVYFDAPDAVGGTSLTHSKLQALFPADADLAGAEVSVHYNPGDNVDRRPIDSYDAGTGTITFAQVAGIEPLYSVANAVRLIDGPEQFVVGPDLGGTRRLWVWPASDPNAAPIEHAVRDAGLDVADRDHIHVRGLTFQQFSSTGFAAFVGSHSNMSQEKEGVELTDCIVRGVLSSVRGGGATALGLGKAYGGSKIRNCLVRDCKGSHGIGFSGAIDRHAGGEVTLNRIERTTGTAIRPHSSRGVVVAHNDIGRVVGTHGNGMSIYGSSSTDSAAEILVFGNRLRTETTAIPLAHQDVGDLVFMCNLIVMVEGDGRGIDNNSNRDAGVSGGVTGPQAKIDYAFNTVVCDGAANPAASFSGMTAWRNTGNAEHSFLGNVVHGFTDGGSSPQGIAGAVAGNVVTGRASGQPAASPFLGIAGLAYDDGLAGLFADHGAEDLRPRAGGALDGAGPDASAVVARALAIAPGFDLMRDLQGRAVTSWAAGAHVGAVQATG